MALIHSGGNYLGFLLGLLAGILFAAAIAVWSCFQLANWLVVDGDAQRAEIAAVLGGGGGRRLRKGLELLNHGVVGALVLVDTKANYWDDMLARLCPECKAGGKPMTILTGSTSTLTDAQLVREHCLKHGIKRILVVTDPYHTRRASILFNRQFANNGTDMTTVSSGDYGSHLPPTEKWWRDEHTLRTVWAEAGKVGAFFLTSLSAQR